MPAIIETNSEEFRSGAKVLDDALAEIPYLVGDCFSVTDIIVGWTLNLGLRSGHLDGFGYLHAYLERLLAREFCTLVRG